MLKAIFGRSRVIDTTRASSYPCEGTKTRASFAVAYAPALGGGCGGGGGDDIGACLTREGAEESLQQNFALMENAHARERKIMQGSFGEEERAERNNGSM